MAKTRTRLRLRAVRLRDRPVAGQVPGLRQLEHAAASRLASPRPSAGDQTAQARARRRRRAPAHRRHPRWTAMLRRSTGIGELDRVLGGGMVEGVAAARGRRPGHRQVHPAHPGVLHNYARRWRIECSTSPARNPRGRSRCAPSRLGASGSAAVRALGKRHDPPWSDSMEKIAARRDGGGLHPDHVPPGHGRRARLGVAGARVPRRC